MVGRYADDDVRMVEGTSFGWRVFGLAHATVRGLEMSFDAIDARDGWTPVLTYALTQKREGSPVDASGPPPFWRECGPAGSLTDGAWVRWQPFAPRHDAGWEPPRPEFSRGELLGLRARGTVFL